MIIEDKTYELLALTFDIHAPCITLNKSTQTTAVKALDGSWLLEALLTSIEQLLRLDDTSAARASIQSLHDQVESILNTGHYSDVEERFRLFFSLVCLGRAWLSIKDNKLKKALRICDDGLLKGYDLDEDILARLAELLNEELGPLKPIVFAPCMPQPPPRPLSTSQTIQTVELPSLERFYCDYLKPRKPVIIKDMVPQWPCYEKWSFEFFYQTCGRRMVPIEYGKRYTDEDFTQRLESFGDFLRTHVADAEPAETAYLAQHRLLDQVPALRSHVVVPDFCSLDDADDAEPELLNVFIGPATTVSPLHSDPRHNFFCQIRGRKFVRLIDPIYSDSVYQYQNFLQANSSQIDVEHPDYDEYPRFRDVPCEDYIMELGDCLYIPKRYLHYVRALEPSISVSIWFGKETDT